MRRTLPLIVIATLAVVSCGSASDEPAEGAEDPGTVATATGDEAPADTGASESETTDTEPAEASDTSTDTEPTDTEPTDTEPTDTEPGAADPELEPPQTNPDKPTDIDFPGEAPEKLVVTVLEPGSGPEAELGDTVIVDYIGVRSLDGVEFDNSYDRFTPFPVGPLGEASVIQGWNDGLIGAQTGSRLQLDIPADQAYGDSARSDIIRENEPLTFVIDVRAVIAASDPADAPSEPGTELSEGATSIVTDDLIVGEGATLEAGQTAVFHLVLFRGNDGEQLDSTWATEPIQLPMNEGNFAGLVEGMPGMAVGGRRAITVPPELGFGPEGNPQLNLPADTDIIIVVDLLGLY